MSQNFPTFEAENFVVRGNEIVPYVRTPDAEKLYAEMESRFHEHLYILFRESVKKSVSAIKFPLPENISALISSRTPVGSTATKPGVANSMSGEKVRKRYATTVLGMDMVSFQVPEGFPDVDVDKLPLPEEVKKLWGSHPKKYSLSQRLEGWTVEHRVRANLHIDPYFHHSNSQLCLRSYIEVAKFLLYEVNPKLKVKTEKPTPVRLVEGSDNKGKRKRDEMNSDTKREKTLSKPVFTYEEMVKKFLADARNNLDHFGTGSPCFASNSKGQKAKGQRTSKKGVKESFFSADSDILRPNMKEGNNTGPNQADNENDSEMTISDLGVGDENVQYDTNGTSSLRAEIMTSKEEQLNQQVDQPGIANMTSKEEQLNQQVTDKTQPYQQAVADVNKEDNDAQTAAELMLLLGNGNANNGYNEPEIDMDSFFNDIDFPGCFF